MSIRPADTWRVRRMAIGGVLGFVCATAIRALDFWPVQRASDLRAFLGLLGVPLLLIVTLIALLVAALVSLYRSQFRRMASSFVAIALVPLCFLTVVRAPIFDPWLWYVILNKSRLDAAAGAYTQTIIEERDVSIGLVGLNPGHSIELIYSESNIDGQTTGNSSTTHLYGNFYRRDEFF